VAAVVVSVVAVAIVLFLFVGAIFGLGFFTLEAGTGQWLAANHVQEGLDASIKVICVLHVASNRGKSGCDRQKWRP
jgi:hypothetical protein